MGSPKDGIDTTLTYNKTFERIAFATALVLSILVPLSVHAGLFSDFFDKALADQGVSPYEEYRSDEVPLLKAALNVDPNRARGGGDVLVEDGALIPSGDADKKEEDVNTKTANGEISVYIVRECTEDRICDTLSDIAEMYDVSVKTIMWANNIKDPARIRPGDTLVILPITGVRHIVKAGDTPTSLAKKYSSDTEEILSYNQITTGVLVVGDTVIIPDGTIAPPPTASVRGGVVGTGGGSIGFVHPVPGATRTQGIHGYNGVDLAAPVGTAVRAAQGGTVIVARGSGWNGGYGLYVVVKHPNGTQTLYAHLSSVSVTAGDSVASGQTIGAVGNTGRSTGSHLHFEVRGAKNPF